MVSLINTINGNDSNNTLSGNDSGIFYEINGLGGNDSLVGNNGNDTLIGNDGDDTLNGGLGIDSLFGGAGDDIYIIDNIREINKTISDGGTNTVLSSITYTLGGYQNNLTLTGTKGIKGTGNNNANIITGNSGKNTLSGLNGDDTILGEAGNDTLTGGAGNDTLYGGTGGDSMVGGAGNDNYYVDNSKDKIKESSGAGTDKVISSAASYTLSSNIEILELDSEAGNIDGKGNSLANTIIGNSGNNRLYGMSGIDSLEGGDGNDTLDGGSGIDILVGGDGNDTYIIDSTLETVTEDTAEGIDTIQIDINYSLTLSSEVENLTLTGSAIIGEGNELDNVITGNYKNNTLNGLDGDDTLFGLDGNDILDGGDGENSLVGGKGNDTYYVNSESDTIFELSGQGTDKVYASIDYTIQSHIENLTLLSFKNFLGEGNDQSNTITGNELGNTLVGNGGNDRIDGADGNDYIDGGTGNDTLVGGAGADTLDGGAGIDSMIGGDGDDVYYVDSLLDKFVEASGQGTDTVNSSINYTLSSNVELLLLGDAAGDINGTGNSSNNTIIGNEGNNILNGGGGIDSLAGGGGNDTYIIDNSSDQILESSGEGTDLVQSSVSYSLSSNIENLQLTGSSIINGYGNELANSITGNTKNNNLYGYAGDDTIYGAGGTDSLIGGEGNDTYIIDNSSDQISENADEGIDLVQSSVSYSLGSNVENLELSGTATIGYGSDVANIITGNNKNNTLYGFAGNDTLDGGTGNDTLYGGADNDSLVGGDGNDYLDGGIGTDILEGGTGNDTYIIDSSGDQISEAASAGIDTVIASIDFTLDNNIENLLLTDSAESGEGNALANLITGNDNDNILTGNEGNDTLIGNSGNDTLDGDIGTDSMTGGSGDDSYYVDSITDKVTEAENQGIDTINTAVSYTLSSNVENLIITETGTLNGTGNALANTITVNDDNNTLSGLAGNDTLLGNGGNDTLYGGDGNDLLDGGNDTDSMIGGAGNDTYVVDNCGDTISESSTGGTDTVRSTMNFSLSNYIENLELLGGAESGEGNSLANVITGNGLSNTLNGNAGNDTLIGGAGDDNIDGGTGFDSMTGGDGDDTYYVDSTRDTVVEAGITGSGTDTVVSSISYTIGNNIENLTLSGTIGLSGTGNELDNTITGTDYGDTLNGGSAGNDVLIGGNGNDTYIINNASAQISENSDEGIDSVQSSITYSLGNNIENLTLTGTAAINGTGNELNNRITGNSNINALYGLAGNDTLDGGAGPNSLFGGEGDDTYVIANIVTNISENSDEGIDSVQSSITYSLGNNIENLTLTGSVDIDGTGNSLDNIITGNDKNNILDGGDGSDSLIGDSGNDTYTYSFGSGNDTIYDTAGTDTLILDGVNPDNFFAYRDGDDLILDFEETDDNLTCKEWFTNKTNRIESVEFTQDPERNITDLQNWVFGELGDDTLTGDSLNNTIVGGYGDDLLRGEAGNDTYMYALGEGSDTIVDTSGTDTLKLYEDVTMDKVISFTQDNSGNLTLNFVGGGSLTIPNTIEKIYFGSDDVTINTSAFSDLFDFDPFEDVVGTLGDDDIEGQSTGEEEEYIYGLTGNDTITGGQGMDISVDFAGNDTYKYTFGDGSDIIIDFGGNDTISFTGDDITSLEDITYKKYLNHLIIQIDQDGSEIVVANHFNIGKVEYIQFGDSTPVKIPSNPDNVSSLSDFSNNNILMGSIGANTIDGNEGHDILIGLQGNDTYKFGIGYGEDVIVDEDGNDTIVFGSGITAEDLVFTPDGNDLVIAINQEDRLVLTDYLSDEEDNTYKIEYLKFAGSSTLVSLDSLVPEEFDTIPGGDETLYVGDENDNTLAGSTGDDSIWGGAGNDTLIGLAGNDTIDGGDGDDYLIGDDTIPGGGNDTIYGGSGNDSIAGGAGNDSIIGGNGNDEIFGYEGSDTIIGGIGDDRIHNGEQNNPGGQYGDFTYMFNSGDGNDTIDNRGHDGDTISFGEGITLEDLNFQTVPDPELPELVALQISFGTDSITLLDFDNAGTLVFSNDSTFDLANWESAGNDTPPEEDNLILGTINNDNLSGTEGDDTISGLAGNDTISGGTGNDSIVGGEGLDSLIGGAGNDTITAGTGNDTIYGNEGNNTYFFGESTGDGNDTIYCSSGNDTLILDVEKSVLRFEQVNTDDLKIILNSNNTVTIADWFVSDSNKLGTLYAVNGEFKPNLVNYYNANYDSDADTISYDDYDVDGVYGTSSNDVITVPNENDIDIFGYAGNDTYDMGTGFNTFEDSSGDENYTYSVGDGTKVIMDMDGNDTLTIQGDVSISCIDYRTHLIIKVGDNINDKIIIANFYDGQMTVENIAYHGNAPVSISELLPGNVYHATSLADPLLSSDGGDIMIGDGGYPEAHDSIVSGLGDDTIVANEGNDTIYGGAGNDYIQDGEGVDIIYGEAGNDTMRIEGLGDGISGQESFYGGDGNDTYIFNKYDISAASNSLIVDSSGNDTITFENSINKDDNNIAFYLNGSNLEIDFGSDETAPYVITVQGQVSSGSIERIQIADGYYLSASDINTIIANIASHATNASNLTSLEGVKNDAGAMAYIASVWHT